MKSPPRLLPNRPLPDYSYVPGLWPHPHSQAGGIDWSGAFGASPPDPSRWWECVSYLFGIDLWNHGYYWEAHEAWESVWNAAGRRGPTADFFKGLIQLAVSGVKVREKREESVVRHARRAAELFGQVAGSTGEGLFFGVSALGLAALAEEIAGHPPTLEGPDDANVRVVFEVFVAPVFYRHEVDAPEDGCAP